VFLKRLSVAVALAMGLSAAANAATVGFSFAGYTGVLTFDGIGDTSANSIEITTPGLFTGSYVVSDDPIQYPPIFYPNSFGWTNGFITSAAFRASKSVAVGSYGVELSVTFRTPSDPLSPVVGFVDCQSPIAFGQLCPNNSYSWIEQGPATFTYAAPPSTVPLPAGLPLLFAGLGGLAIFRKRTSRVVKALVV
jgi:hypothetical protein